MYKAGGIIAIIAGIFGIFAAGFTLLFGGVASAFKADGGSTVVALGWGGVVFSFLVIVFGAISLSRIRWAGIALILSSIFGIALGGTLVAVFMCLSLIGGILVTLDSKAKNKAITNEIHASNSSAIPLGSSNAQFESKKQSKGLLFGGALLAISLIGSIAYFAGSKSNNNDANGTPQSISNSGLSSSPSTVSIQAINEILNAEPENHDAVINCMALGIKPDSVVSIAERENCQVLISKKPIVDFMMVVKEVKKPDDNKYVIYDDGILFSDHLQAVVNPQSDEEKTKLKHARRGDAFQIKGRLVFNKDEKIFSITPAYLIPLKQDPNARIVSKVNTSIPTEASQPQINPAPIDAVNTANSPAPHTVPVPASIYQVCNLDGNGEKYLALKEGASASSARVLKMAEGTALTVLDKNSDWYQVKMADGKIGWAHSKWLCQSNGKSTVTDKTPSTASSNQSIAPSFNCLNASTRVEKMICNSEELSKLDAQLSVVYKATLSVDPEKELLKKYQDNWRKNIRDACSIESCVKSVYKNRIAELK